MLRGPKKQFEQAQAAARNRKWNARGEGYILSPMEMSTELVFWRDMIAATNSRLAEYFRPE